MGGDKTVAGTVAQGMESGGAASASAMGGAPPPRLRQTLDIFPAEPDADGEAAWLLHDRLANRYFRVGSRELDLLALVDGRSAQAIAAEAGARLGRFVTAEEVEGLFAFLRENDLVFADAAQAARHARLKESRPGRIPRMLHGYISFRIPLLRPDRFLTAALPWVQWLGSRWTFLALGILAVMGLYLVSRQWDVFLATIVSFLSLEGLLGYVLAIIFVKACHEFGHAFAAKAHGLRVPTIGVAFIVFWPIAYTDTTDAWRLTRKRDRLGIGAAGVLVEMGIAAVCLFLWNVVPDGPFRSILFLLATTSWAISLLVNLNPLMRFDGYFVFSDLIGVPNLERRGHADAKYWLRRMLFGWDEPLGEDPPRRRFALFGAAIWVFRFFLFLGIALAVYHLFFKALGIVLFLVEIYYFILRPIARELREWWGRRDRIRINGAVVRTGLVLGGLVAVLALPWQSRVVAPAILQSETASIYAPESARVGAVRVEEGDVVEPGTILIVLESPDLTHELEQATLRHDRLVLENAALGVDQLRRERGLVIAAQLGGERRRIAELQQRLDRLVLRAPEAGTIRDMRTDISEGAWLSDAVSLMEIERTGRPQYITALVEEQDVSRLRIGSAVSFYAEDGLTPAVAARIRHIDLVAETDIPMSLASSTGGGINVRVTADGERQPLTSVYRVTAVVEAETPTSSHMLRGRGVIEAEARSPLEGIWRRLVALIVRESSL
jgi:putative peptide zinc metalloprotease protein